MSRVLITHAMVQFTYMKKVPLIILLIISFTVSRFIFFLIDDPEGPNLLIVSALAGIIFAPLVFIYQKTSKTK